jgi:4'-phosphopantetheinyl transferase EntD
MFAGIIAYPVSFEKRVVPRPTVPGSEYFCRVSPLGENRGGLSFNIRIYDALGNLCDAVLGMLMKPIAGAERPACRAGNPGPGLFDALGTHCLAFSIIELEAVLPFYLKALTAGEMDRIRSFGPKRLRSFAAGRLAFKRVWRQVTQDYKSAAEEIPDITHDAMPGGTGDLFYSISHDNRFAFAAAGNTKIGVDVEEASHRAVKSRRIFLNEGDNKAMEAPSELDQLQKSLRVWSAKESLSKATGKHVAGLWKDMSAKRIGNDRTELSLAGREYSVVHGRADGHLFTITSSDREY